jgi:lysine 2,3-aminomutase
MVSRNLQLKLLAPTKSVLREDRGRSVSGLGTPEWWTDWRAQQQYAVSTAEQLREHFTELSESEQSVIRERTKSRRLRITPFALSLVSRDPERDAPAEGDPVWRQLVPQQATEGSGPASYDGTTENWEMPHEMVTPIAQRKYDNRVIVRVANICHSYCQFCYEALRTLETESSKESFAPKHWEDTLEYVKRTPEIEEVILSGGEPLMLGDTQLERVLRDLSSIKRGVLIRIHTRALTFNPFRVTEDLCRMLSYYKVSAVGLHVASVGELSAEFRGAAASLSRSVPILFANIPLLRGVNDEPRAFRELLMGLYRAGVVPHYLYHFMPFSPGGSEMATAVRTGVELVRSVKRHITDLAVPEFVLPHHTGKHTMPLLGASESAPVETLDAHGHPIVRYVNWQGHEVEYADWR